MCMAGVWMLLGYGQWTCGLGQGEPSHNFALNQQLQCSLSSVLLLQPAKQVQLASWIWPEW